MSRAKNWVFTLNNPTDEEKDFVSGVIPPNPQVEYLVYGRETGANGTPHLQGFIQFNTRKRLGQVRALLQRAHWERARGTPQQASLYCKKDGDFDEFGAIVASEQGRRTDFDRLRDFVLDLGSVPTDRELAANFPSLFSRCNRIRFICESFLPTPELVPTNAVPREGWQQDLVSALEEDPDPRKIIFVVDPVGNTGKSWMCQYLFSRRPHLVQVLSIGKRDDLAHAIDPSKSWFLFDIPRQSMEFLQYAVLEKLKDRLVFSPKYASTVKVLTTVPHVVVFCNEQPDRNAMSQDRYVIIDI